jgi:hypothetical protein
VRHATAAGAVATTSVDADGRPPDGPASGLHSTREWLVTELRDECSDIGVSARGFDLAGYLRGAQTFGREARRLGATAAQMLVLLKGCLADERLPREDREVYQQYHDSAMSAAIAAYYEGATPPTAADAGSTPADDTRSEP